jgi:hypothetical protein
MSTIDISQVIDRMKNLRLFTVEVELPEGFELYGVMPFDVSIKQNKGWFKVYAVTLEEATEKVNEFIASKMD